jgi:hypothetical protein
MKTTRPLIGSDQELAGYRAGAEKLEKLISHHEGDLMQTRHAAEIDARKLDQIRHTLHRLYGYYQGLMNAFDVYVRR